MGNDSPMLFVRLGGPMASADTCCRAETGREERSF